MRANDRVYTGINDLNTEGEYKFLDGTEASIKVDPGIEEDLFIGWAAGEPTGERNEAEDNVEISMDGRFNDVAGTTQLKAMCEKGNAHCHEGFTFIFEC